MCVADRKPVEPIDVEACAGTTKATPESPKRSARRSSLKADLLAPVTALEDPRTLHAWDEGTRDAFRPGNAWQAWMAHQVAVIMAQINRVEWTERRLRNYLSLRAIDFWEDDQKLAAETLGLKLPKTPARVVAQLSATPAGCDWLIARWRGLAQADRADWTEDQRTLAGLLNTGKALDLNAPGCLDRIIFELQAQRTRAEAADAITRSLVEADLSDNHSPDLARLRRHERSLHRRLEWFVAELRVSPLERRREDPRPNFGPTPQPAEPFGSMTENDETNPFSEPVAENDETNPFSPVQPKPENDETNPSEPAQPVEVVEPEKSEVIAKSEVASRGQEREDDRIAARKRRIDPKKAVARLREARRRSA